MSRDESTRPAAEGRFDELGRVHLLGIGGVGVSGVARILQDQGVAVSGSDAKDLPVMRELAAADRANDAYPPRPLWARGGGIRHGRFVFRSAR